MGGVHHFVGSDGFHPLRLFVWWVRPGKGKRAHQSLASGTLGLKDPRRCFWSAKGSILQRINLWPAQQALAGEGKRIARALELVISLALGDPVGS